MMLDPESCYRALVARDHRFDGRFFVGVETTGIYCRPVCRARTPGRARCSFYQTAAEAEHHGFRACFRCRPELAPGSAPVDAAPRLVSAALSRIEAGALNEQTVDGLAAELEITGRHLRRAMREELGVTPVELAQSQRLALARQLLWESSLPVTEVALSSGFRSVRRFNALFRARHGRAPSELRKARAPREDAPTVAIALGYRPPYDWDSVLGFLAARAIPGVELIREGRYLRTVQLGAAKGWIVVSQEANRHALRAVASLSLAGVLMPLSSRLRRLFDLDAHPTTIAAHLSTDPLLAGAVKARPGMRVPGAFEAFETSARAILGQQVSVAAASTLASRLTAHFGERIETPHPELHLLSPAPARIARASSDQIAGMGITRSRAQTLRVLAGAMANGALGLETLARPEALMARLMEIPGIGPWTASYIAMRVLGWPDAFPESDLGLRKALGGLSSHQVRERAERWRPWRAYAVMYLWTHASGRNE
jgi:AraC family transcriptional regulator of adaptative response / DNA-3-methyladenine glycosylase II